MVLFIYNNRNRNEYTFNIPQTLIDSIIYSMLFVLVIGAVGGRAATAGGGAITGSGTLGTVAAIVEAAGGGACSCVSAARAQCFK